jgi:hypothetical protein
MDVFIDCNHKYVEEGICLKCGLNITSNFNFQEKLFSKQYQCPKRRHISILEKEILQKSLPPEITSWILQRLITFPKLLYRSEIRTVIIFSLIYMAYINLKKQFDPIYYSKTMNMSKKDIELALKFISNINNKLVIQNNESIAMTVIQPHIIVPLIYKELNMDNLDILEDLLKISKDVIDLDPSLLEENPRNVSFGIILYYCETYKIQIKNIDKRKNITYNKYKKWIKKILSNVK